MSESAADIIGAKLSFVATYTSAMLNGIVFTFFLFILHLARQRGSKIEKKMVVASVLLFFFPSVHLWSGVHRAQLKYVDAQIALQVGDQSYNPNENTAGVLFSASCFILNLFLSDMVMIYRCYMVWNFRKTVIILPVLTWLASGATNAFVVFLNTQDEVAYNTGFMWGTVSLTLSLATNLIVTTLIVFRIWRLRSELAATLGWQHAKTYTSIIAMIVESAALYAVVMLVFIITWATNSPAQGLLLYTASQVSSIAPMLVIVRVGLGRSTTEYTTAQASSGVNSKFTPRSIRLHTTTDTFVDSRTGNQAHNMLSEKRSVDSV